MFIWQLRPMELAARSDVGVRESGSNLDSKLFALSYQGDGAAIYCNEQIIG